MSIHPDQTMISTTLTRAVGTVVLIDETIQTATSVSV
jgi:hypothetical protein